MASVVSVFLGACLLTLLLVAAWTDVRSRRIPNRIPLAMALLFPVHALAAVWPEPLLHLAAAAVVLAAGFALFACGLLGGGDAKLLAALALWAGPAATPGLVLWTCVSGGLLAVFWLLRARILPLLAPALASGTTGPVAKVSLPYALAMLPGGMAFAVLPLWG